ncbi:DNA-binding transcriptional repressor TetR [Paraconexibacter sp. AEG42_29]|uniref:DNA-binding transcriptional repressor TetR n=1 Tax=Paraconexibacter sp. AEG42_29 TaxID=2997339 RepID=A0AAU7AUS7_9ACTN
MSPRPRNQQSQAAILAAVLQLVEDDGYERLTIEGIAARAGVGKTTIYRWWPSKDAVLLDAYLDLQERSGGTELPDTGDLRADLRLLLTRAIAGMTDPRFDAPYRALTAAMQHDPALAGEVSDRLLRPLLALTRSRLARSQARGEIRADVDLDLAVELLYGPVLHRWLLRTRPFAEDDGSRLADLVHRAVAPTS